MKDNKHPHHDLIVEWAKDTSKEIDIKTISGEFASDKQIGIINVVNDTLGSYEFRFKPREFTKGHWYPCVDKDYDVCVYFYEGKNFSLTKEQGFVSNTPDSMIWIGESLGEINFG